MNIDINPRKGTSLQQSSMSICPSIYGIEVWEICCDEYIHYLSSLSIVYNTKIVLKSNTIMIDFTEYSFSNPLLTGFLYFHIILILKKFQVCTSLQFISSYRLKRQLFCSHYILNVDKTQSKIHKVQNTQEL